MKLNQNIVDDYISLLVYTFKGQNNFHITNAPVIYKEGIMTQQAVPANATVNITNPRLLKYLGTDELGNYIFAYGDNMKIEHTNMFKDVFITHGLLYYGSNSPILLDKNAYEWIIKELENIAYIDNEKKYLKPEYDCDEYKFILTGFKMILSFADRNKKCLSEGNFVIADGNTRFSMPKYAAKMFRENPEALMKYKHGMETLEYYKKKGIQSNIITKNVINKLSAYTEIKNWALINILGTFRNGNTQNGNTRWAKEKRTVFDVLFYLLIVISLCETFGIERNKLDVKNARILRKASLEVMMYVLTCAGQDETNIRQNALLSLAPKNLLETNTRKNSIPYINSELINNSECADRIYAFIYIMAHIENPNNFIKKKCKNTPSSMRRSLIGRG